MTRTLALLALLSGAQACHRDPVPGEAPAPGGRDRVLTAAPPPPEVAPEARAGLRRLEVAAARPQGVLSGSSRVTITFSQPMVALDPLDPAGAAVEGPAKAIALAPAVKGSWRWLGSASVELVPEAMLPASQAFTVTVPAGFAALDGSRLEEAYRFRFTTPVPQVERTLTQPSGEACRFSEPEQLFSVVLSQPIAEPERVFSFDAGGQRIAATVLRAVRVQDEQRAKEVAEPDQARRRRFERASPEELAFPVLQTRYELKPAQPLPRAAPFALELDASAHGSEGPLTLQEPWRFPCSTYGPIKVAGLARCWEGADRCSYGPIFVDFTGPLGEVAEVRKRLSLEPAAPLDWSDEGDDAGASLERERTRLRVPARLRPGTEYTVRLQAGVKDRFGQQAPAFEGKIALDDLRPSLFLGREVALLEAAGDGMIPVQVTNLARVAADLWALTPEEYAALRFCRAPACRFPQRAPDTELRLPLAYGKNEQRLHGLDARAALKGRKTGLVGLRVWAPDTASSQRPLRVLAQVTDVVVHAKVGAAGGVAWITSAQAGTKIPGAQVRVLDAAGALLAEAVADGDGLAALPPLSRLQPLPRGREWEGPRLLVTAQAGSELGLVTTEWSDQLRSDAAYPAFDVLVPRPAGVVFTDRGIYRPGDAVQVKALLRVLSPGTADELLPPQGEVKLEVRDPGGQLLLQQAVKVSPYGSAGAEVKLPAEGRLGSYDVVFSSADDGRRLTWYGSFRVAEYRPPQFRVDLLAAAPAATAGDGLSATVSARYLFGAAMTGAQLRWSATRTSARFAPQQRDGFVFGRNTWGLDEGEPAPDAGFAAGGRGAVDARGNFAIEAGKAEAPGDRPTTYTLEAEVQDVSRQTVAGRTAVLVHPASIYLGLGKRSLFADAGKPFELPVIAVRPDGAASPGAAVRVTALLRSWHSVRKKGAGGTFESVTEAVDAAKASCELKSAAEAVPCALTLGEPGFYTLRAEAKDEAGRLALTTGGLYVLGKGFAAWQRGDSPRVELVADKSEYAVGEVARVLIKSPYPECQALISLEREGVIERRVQRLSGTATAIEVPITEAMVPNVFVGVVLQRARVAQGGIEEGDDPGRPSARAGYVELLVGREVKRLAVSLSVPHPEWRPRQRVPVEVTVRDQAGAPQRAEVILYAVDEGVLRLTDYQVPDPIAEMFPRRSLGVVLGEPLVSLVRRQRFGEKGEVQPGGGGGSGPAGSARSKFLTTALWTTLETGADGRARAEIDLPDNLTTFRLMAVAQTARDRFGSGQGELRVSLPLLVLPALPRFARAGDSFEAGVVVNAKGLAERASPVTVTAEVSGAAALAAGQAAEEIVTVEEGVAREVRFKLEAKAAGTARLIFRASAPGDPGKGGPFADRVEQALPVQRPVDFEAVAIYGETDSARTEGLVAPSEVQPGSGGLSVTLSSSVLGGLGEGMRQLIDYPYGCLEQLSSRLVPFVALREVQKLFGVEAGNADAARRAEQLDALLQRLTGSEEQDRIDAGAAAGAEAVVARTVARISELQAPSGGFRYWPGAACAYTWPSIYATLALHRAREAGFPVRREVLEEAKRFLARAAEGKQGCPGEAPGPETRAFALQVLARMGAPRPAFYDELYAGRDRLPLFGKALLADAMAIGGGQRPRAQALLQEVLDAAQETPGEVHFAEKDPQRYAPLFSSDVRTTGMVLQTLVDLQPGHPYLAKIARYFHSVRRGGAFRNTQEAAYALMGLTEVVRVRERTAPDFTATVSLGGRELLSQRFTGRSLSVVTRQVPIEEVTAAARQGGKAGAPFLFSVQGPGMLTYGARLRYAPAELPTKARDEGIFVQRWLEPFDAAGRAATDFDAGELVRVRVRVATRAERHFVALEVSLPAGLEAVDTQLASTAQRPAGAGEEGGETTREEGFDDRGAGELGPWSPFVYSEKRDDRVVYFADLLPAGVQLTSFVARATTPGRFLLKPARAEEMYTPEVFGRSEGGTVTVGAARPLSAR